MPKLNLDRVPMPRQVPKVRGKNFDEVALGYSSEQEQEQAQAEAKPLQVNLN